MHIDRRFYLAGSPDNEGFNAGLYRLFEEQIYPQAREAGRSMFVLYYEPSRWEESVPVILAGKDPMQDPREVYVFRELRKDWRALIPPGFAVRQVDRKLLEEGLAHSEQLAEEMLSEAPSVEAFLRGHFGFCLVGEDEIVGWCLSEYNWQDRCEVGLETVEGYRRRGVATITASALAEYALEQGVTHIGWHCWASNVASGATALRAGFEKEREYRVYFAWFEPVMNMAVHGNRCFTSGEYEAAVEWYERAMGAGDPPPWVYWNAACAAARAGRPPVALEYLQQAIERGFDDWDRVMNSEHLDCLRGTAEWRALMERF
jgi:RimJ/RimL family protein N-acetyltransferase